MGRIASEFAPFIQDLIESINWLVVAYFLFLGFSMIAATVILGKIEGSNLPTWLKALIAIIGFILFVNFFNSLGFF